MPADQFYEALGGPFDGGRIEVSLSKTSDGFVFFESHCHRVAFYRILQPALPGYRLRYIGSYRKMEEAMSANGIVPIQE